MYIYNDAIHISHLLLLYIPTAICYDICKGGIAMGSWFSNLHIRKNELLSKGTIIAYITKIMAQRQYTLVPSEEEADAAFAIVTGKDSQWYSVYSDLFNFENPKAFTEYAAPMSEELGTDILGIACFDSDYLYLNLVGAAGKVDAWACIGSAAGLGIRRRTNLTAWKQKVDHFDHFQASVKQKYVFAEEILGQIENCIHLPLDYAMASYEYLADLGLEDGAACLYFKLPEAMKSQEPPRLFQRTASLMPCRLGEPATVEAVNEGGASTGLSVFFIGPYVEHEELTFSDVCIVRFKNNQTESFPIELKKVQLTDGQWAYYYHDPGYRIPPKADERLPVTKRWRIESQRQIVVRFIPHGNPRKVLDITVVLVPDRNPQGQTGWNVWYRFGSKKAFIEHYNNNIIKYCKSGKLPNWENLLLREEDFD